MHTMVLYLYLALSSLLYLMYWFDKRAAVRGGWRVKESSLHTLAAMGGWPGAFLAQRILRHKTKKVSFRFQLWATVMINGGLIFGLHTTEGMDAANFVTGLVRATQ